MQFPRQSLAPEVDGPVFPGDGAGHLPEPGPGPFLAGFGPRQFGWGGGATGGGAQSRQAAG
eukprot:732696-Lingulodinium_polyedra.AAC.1